jgi:hypothetical protein
VHALKLFKVRKTHLNQGKFSGTLRRGHLLPLLPPPPLLYLHTRKHTHASALPLFAPLFSFQDMRLSNSALMQDLAASRAQNRDKEQELCDAYARLERTEARCSELEAG